MMILCKSIEFVLLLILITRTTLVFCFNFEERNPIVKRAKTTESGSYFGFSVAQHKTKLTSQNLRDNWILIGAPLGQNLQPDTNRSGALYKCPITNDAYDCIQIETDGRRLYDFDYEDEPTAREPVGLLGPGRDEIKDGQWLGVTVRSQKPGGKVVVCAHRYIQSINLNLHHYGLGLCYLLNNELQVELELQPCKGRPMEKLHQQYGFCQVGTSLAFLDDGYTLMGAPGPFTWRGTIFVKQVEGKRFNYLDKIMYKGPLNDNAEPINKYSYLGMSVSGGNFFNKNRITYVAGAPRSQLYGQVYFMERTQRIEDLNITFVLTGEQFASSFGYEILTIDIDQDGYDELLVGAPFYYEGDKYGGAVYIYKNLKDCRTASECRPSAILKGKPESRFGFSMTTLGDINKDGINDVAIGAPYEDDIGAIYIYLGNNQDGVLNAEPSQIIKRHNLKTLGYSLSGGLDMDNNGYPDLLVGAYEMDLAILYKTRPIIDITITIKSSELHNINMTKKGCNDDPQNLNNACFTFRSCFQISDIKSATANSFKVRYHIREIPNKIPRVWFRDERFPNNHLSTNSRDIDVTSFTEEYCQKETVYINEGIGDILSPIKFIVNYTLARNEIDSPILNKTSIEEFQATFQKSCGDDDVCESNLVLNIGTQLELTEDGYVLDLGQNEEFILDVNVTNYNESAYEAKLFVVHPESLSYIALLVDKKNKTNLICSYENDTLVSCNLGNPFQEKRSIDLHLRFEVKSTKDQTLNLQVYVNSTSKELSNQTEQSMVVILQKIAEYHLEGKSIIPHFFYAGELSKHPEQVEYFENVGDRILHSYQIINNGHWQMNDIEINILWPYQIKTDDINAKKWLLYLEKQPEIDGSLNYCYVEPSEIVNELKLNSSGVHTNNNNNVDNNEVPENFTKPVSFVADPGYFRTKRHTDDGVIPARTIEGPDGKLRKVVTFDCIDATARCAKITCIIKQLFRNDQVKILITSRIWNSTLSKDYNKVDWVSIRSNGVVKIPDPTIIHSNQSIASVEVETIGYPGIVLADASLNIWIIVGAVIAGILLLIILILILYKFGFFKRNRIKDQTLSGNLKKQGESESLLKVNEAKT